MRKLAICAIFFTVFILKALAQKTTDTMACDFFGPLKFSKGKATVVIKATYNELHRDDGSATFKQLAKQKRLFYKDYFSRCCSGSGISFTPENCLFEYAATINKNVNLGSIKLGQMVYLTCSVFEGFEGYHHLPFFVIEKINYKKEDIVKSQNTKPLIYIESKYINNEAGCSYFSNDANLLYSELKCVLKIDSHYMAFMQTADKNLHFSFAGRVLTPNGYIDTYKNETSSFELSINKIIKTGNIYTYRNGRLTLTIDSIKTSFNVFGIAESADLYNKPN